MAESGFTLHRLLMMMVTTDDGFETELDGMERTEKNSSHSRRRRMNCEFISTAWQHGKKRVKLNDATNEWKVTSRKCGTIINVESGNSEGFEQMRVERRREYV